MFLAPELVREFSPLQMTIGRYLCYGLIAAVLVAPHWRALFAGIPRHQWWNLAWLALAGNTVYYLLLSSAVQSGGIAMTSLVVGLVPVTVTVVGSLERGAVPLRRLSRAPSRRQATALNTVRWSLGNEASAACASQLPPRPIANGRGCGHAHPMSCASASAKAAASAASSRTSRSAG